MVTAPAAEEQPNVWQLRDHRALTKWQRDGYACADCGRLLLLVTRIRVGTPHDTEGWPYDLFLCELCAIRIAQQTATPTATELNDDP